MNIHDVLNQLPKIKALRNEGKTITEICNILGFKRATIYDYSKRNIDVFRAFHNKLYKYIPSEETFEELEYFRANYMALAGAIIRNAMDEYVDKSILLNKLERTHFTRTPEMDILEGEISAIERWFNTSWCDTLTCGIIEPQAILEHAKRRIENDI